MRMSCPRSNSNLTTTGRIWSHKMFSHGVQTVLFVLLLVHPHRGVALPSYLSNQCSRSLTIGEVIMDLPVVSVSEAPVAQRHGFQVMQDGAAVACGGSISQGDSLTIKPSQSIVDLLTADGWTENGGPNYILEVTNQAIVESGDAERHCAKSRIVNAAGDITMMPLNPGELTIRMLSAPQYGQVYAADECTYTVTGNRDVVTHSGYLSIGGDVTAPWDVSAESLVAGTSYSVLEETSAGAYSIKYSLDATSNTKARTLLESLSDDRQNIQVTVMGFVDGNTIQVATIELCEKDSCEDYKRVPGTEPSDDQVCVADGLCVESSIVDESSGMLTSTFTSDNDAWFAIGFSTPSGGMTGGGNGADVFVCSEEGLRRFWVTDRRNPEDFDGVEIPQDAADAAEVKNLCVFQDGTGRMTFTRSLAASSDTEREIVQGVPQAVIWARGPGERALSSRHSARGEVAVDLTNVAGGVTAVKTKGQWTLWLHLLLMAPAWSLILPMGVAIANRTRGVEGAPAGAWFKLHKTLQRVGWMLQLWGFIFAVVHADKFSAHWQHPHTLIGLAVVIIGTLQPVNALLRPHPPANGWPGNVKPTSRVLFEVVHKGLGWVGIILGMLNVILGALLARHLDFDTPTWAVPLAIGCTGISAFAIYFLVGILAPNNAINKALTGAKPGSTQKA